MFIGILTEEVISQTKNDGLIGALVDVENAVQEITRICNAYNAIDIDFTVLLTHIGFEEDKKLAATAGVPQTRSSRLLYHVVPAKQAWTTFTRKETLYEG